MKNQQGFTVIEVLIVLVILGIVWSVALPGYVESLDRSRSTTCEVYRHNIQVAVGSAIQQKFLKPGDTMPTLQDLVDLGLINDVHECPSGGVYLWPEATLTGWTSPLLNCSVHFVP